MHSGPAGGQCGHICTISWRKISGVLFFFAVKWPVYSYINGKLRTESSSVCISSTVHAILLVLSSHRTQNHRTRRAGALPVVVGVGWRCRTEEYLHCRQCQWWRWLVRFAGVAVDVCAWCESQWLVWCVGVGIGVSCWCESWWLVRLVRQFRPGVCEGRSWRRCLARSQ